MMSKNMQIFHYLRMLRHFHFLLVVQKSHTHFRHYQN